MRQPTCNEFKTDAPIPRRGLTGIEAKAWLKKAFPDINDWTLWTDAGRNMANALAMLPVGKAPNGTIGPWQWAPQATAYPQMHYRTYIGPDSSHNKWTGIIRVRHEQGQDFLVFSYFSSCGEVGQFYLVSSLDMTPFEAFARDVMEFYRKHKDKIYVDVRSGMDSSMTPDIYLDPDVQEPLTLPAGFLESIETQARQFFASPEIFKRHAIRYRRGFLFAGPPGTGKTMTIRHLIRVCNRIRSVTMRQVIPSSRMDMNDLAAAFAPLPDSPLMVILDDIDSLLENTSITRGGLLSLLDGVDAPQGVLILATTNHPERIDPALTHRPSRFDRIWLFDLPDVELRRQYLRRALPAMSDQIVEQTVMETRRWSFAYLNELRTTAILNAIYAGKEQPDEKHLLHALALLSAQFKSGSKRHAGKSTETEVGFKAA